MGLHWQLAPEPGSAAVARVMVRAACRDWRVDEEVCAAARLIASELVNNAIHHAQTNCVLSVTMGCVPAGGVCPGLDGVPERVGGATT
jgi:hypothetical protein